MKPVTENIPVERISFDLVQKTFGLDQEVIRNHNLLENES